MSLLDLQGHQNSLALKLAAIQSLQLEWRHEMLSDRRTSGGPMLNSIFVAVLLLSTLLAAYTGRMEALTQASIKSAKEAVELALGLAGVLAFFLGLMKVAAEAGLLRLLTRMLRPLLRFLFPSVPDDHAAMGAIVFNIASNILGLGNAATPFGIKAMIELETFNQRKGTATDAMIVFLAINTAGFTLIPTTIIGLRASCGSSDPAGILVPTWFASGCATLVAVVAAKWLGRLPNFRKADLERFPDIRIQEQKTEAAASPDLAEIMTGMNLESSERIQGGVRTLPVKLHWRLVGVVLFCLLFLVAFSLHFAHSGRGHGVDFWRALFSFWALPSLIAILVLFGWTKGVKVYELLVEGAKEGFTVSVRIIPYLVVILVMVGAFRASGGLDLLIRSVGPLTAKIGMPAEALPVAVLRPLSGSGSLGLVAEVLKTRGPDSFLGYLVSTIYGSTETTFYVLAVYFGAVGIRKIRHTLPACLLADLAGLLAAVFIVNRLFAGR
jgi:spore maturation protein SpmA